MNTINQADLRHRGAAIFDALEAGGEFVITRRGKAIGKLAPISADIGVTPAAKPFTSYVLPKRHSARLSQEVVTEMRGER